MKKPGADARSRRSTTLWSSAGGVDPALFSYTSGSDHEWDRQLLRWDVIGSLGHVEGLRASHLLRPAEFRRLRAGLRAALRAVDGGKLTLGRKDEDVHTAVENWLTAHHGNIGEMLHTGRSRNDQVACDLRLFLKDRLLEVHAATLALVDRLLEFGRREQRTLWPGYTHTRRAMPSSAALWAGGLAEGLLDTLATLPALWSQVDRSPLGTGAGYGVPLPLNREATARALGFSNLDQVATTPQNGRGKIEAAAVFWCVQLGHDLSRLSSDVILLSAEEFGYLALPATIVTGSSIMPHKRNPDVFELTRGRAAALEGDLSAILALRAKLTGGYHRDFQLLKEPLMRGLSRVEEMLVMLAQVMPRLQVNRAVGRAAIPGDVLATDEVMRRVKAGERFRAAYRDVSAALKRGETFPRPRDSDIIRNRMSTGGIGNPGLAVLTGTSRSRKAWQEKERRRFRAAIRRLLESKAP
ncbi:MAG: lyase family protein [Gemmatimonadota bacterium]